MNKLLYIIIITLFVSVRPLFAQQILGRIVDKNQQPIEYASIIVTLVPDTSKIVASAFSKTDGTFTINMRNTTDSIWLKVSCMGFKTLRVKIPSKVEHINSIVLSETSLQLNEVSVFAYRRALSMQEGKIVVDATKLNLGPNDTFLDILKRTPGVVVSTNTISVQGKEPLVIVDGIKQRIPIENLINYLQSLPSAHLKSIAIKSSATAENKLSGEEATIELTTQRNKENGYNVSNTTYGTLLRNSAYRWGCYADVQGKIGNLSANVTMGYAKSLLKQETTDTYTKNAVDYLQQQSLKTNKDAYFGIVNVTWMPEALRGSINYYLSYFVDDVDRKGFETYQANAIAYNNTDRRIEDWTDLLSTNIEYKSADTLKNQFKLSYGLLTGGDNYQQFAHGTIATARRLIKVMSGFRHIIEASYTLKLPRLTYTIGNQSYFSKLHEETEVNTATAFSMTETILGWYTSARYRFAPSSSLYLGVRAEYARYNYNMTNTDVNTSEWSVAPFASMDFALTSNYNASIYLTMKNNRPGYFSMLPGITYYNDNEYSMGNPRLKSAMQYDFKIQNLIYKYLAITIGFRYTKDYFGLVYRTDVEGKRYIQPLNYADVNILYFDASLPYSFLRGKLNGSLNLYLCNLTYHHVVQDIASNIFKKRNNWYGSGSLYVGYQLRENMGLYINPSFRSHKGLLQQKQRGSMSLDIGAQYTLPKNKHWTFALTADDIFNQNKSVTKYAYGELDVINTKYPNTQSIRMSITYNIGRNSKKIQVINNENDTSRFTR